MTEPYGLEAEEQRICPWDRSNPTTGITKAAQRLEEPVTTTTLRNRPWRQLFPRGTEGYDYDKPVLGSAGERDTVQKQLAAEYARAKASSAMTHVVRHQSSVVCATDGAYQTSFGPSVLTRSRYGISRLWTRHGGGSGHVIAGARDKILALWSTQHGRISDSATDEMGGMHSVLAALVAGYLGPTVAQRIDKLGIATGETGVQGGEPALRWETPDAKSPVHLSIEKGVTDIIVFCDNQDVVRATRTGALKAQPHKGGIARGEGYAMHNQIMKYKEALQTAGASVHICWMPGHTPSCWLNDTADHLADGAAVLAAGDGRGKRSIPTTLRMHKNHARRKVTLLLRNSWFHWDKEETARGRTPSGHVYLRDTVLWRGYTRDRTLPERLQGLMAEERDRWLALPKEIVYPTHSFQAARAITCMRHGFPTANRMMATRAGVPKGDEVPCPGCTGMSDTPQHRFVCESFQSHRDALVEELREATWRNSEGQVDGRTAKEVMQKCWTWDLLVKGDYREASLTDVQRHTAPPVETRQAIANVCHKFLTATHFYRRVYSKQGDVSREVKVLLRVTKVLARRQARTVRQEERQDEDGGESSDEDSAEEDWEEELQWPEGYCEVEGVLGRARCRTTGELRYRVRWKSCTSDEDTWEPEAGLRMESTSEVMDDMDAVDETLKWALCGCEGCAPS
jgi:hypothetical protein